MSTPDPEVLDLAAKYADDVTPEDLARAVQERLSWRLRRVNRRINSSEGK